VTAGDASHDQYQYFQHQQAGPDHAANLSRGDKAALDRVITAAVNHAEGIVGLHPGERSEHGAANEAEDAEHEDLLFFAH